jgi:hypothetical protein
MDGVAQHLLIAEQDVRVLLELALRQLRHLLLRLQRFQETPYVVPKTAGYHVLQVFAAQQTGFVVQRMIIVALGVKRHLEHAALSSAPHTVEIKVKVDYTDTAAIRTTAAI